MAGDSIWYEKDGKDFVLLHQVFDLLGHREEMHRGEEVAIGFTHDPDAETGSRFLSHRHGSIEAVDNWVAETSHRLQRSRFGLGAITAVSSELGENAAAVLRSMQPHAISTNQWDVEDLNRIISTNGYLEFVLEKMGIQLTT